jgi:hypothetical protein
MSLDTPFAPGFSGNPPTVGLTVAVVMASGAPASSVVPMTLPGYCNAVMVSNTATIAAYAAITTNANYTVTAADTPVLSGARVIWASQNGPATIYVGAKPAATLSAAANLYFTPGQGGAGQS